MKIGIISDTHDNARKLLAAVKIFNKNSVDLVIHCGDWVSPFMPHFCEDLRSRIISVFGNNEGDKARFRERAVKDGWNIEFYEGIKELVIDGKRIAVYHGDSKKLLTGLYDPQKYDAVLSGHTHTPIIEHVNEVLHINPGAILGERDSRLVDEYTVAIYDTTADQAEIIYL